MTEVRPEELRVSDDERREVDALLHHAVGEGRLTLLEYEERSGQVWSARTRGELAAVTRDLPGSRPAPLALPGEVRRAVAVMGDEKLQGPYAAGQPLEGWAVMGSAKLDLARSDLPAAVDVRAVAVMGDVQVVVPVGTRVQLVGGMSLMGDRKVRVTDGDGPVVRVRAWALMGSVQVRSADVPTGLAAALQQVSLYKGLVQGHASGHGSGHQHRVTSGSAAVAPAAPATSAPVRRRRRRVVRALVAGALLFTVGGGLLDAVGDDGRLAVMSGAEVAVGGLQEELDVTAVMGGAEVVVAGTGSKVEIDATTMWGGVDVVVAPPSDDVDVPDRTIDIDARALMGGVTVTVPEGTAVRVEGGMLMGGTSCEGCQPLGRDQPTVVVDARGAMGGVSVQTLPAQDVRDRLASRGAAKDEDED